MQFSITTLAVLTSTFSIVSATCYGQGQDGYKGAKLDEVDGLNTACMALAGHYTEGESRVTCVQDSSGTKWNFELHYLRGGYREIGIAECRDGMSKEAHGCEYGGSREYTNWGYTADPNKGYCMKI